MRYIPVPFVVVCLWQGFVMLAQASPEFVSLLPLYFLRFAVAGMSYHA